MRLLACLIVAPQRGYDEPAILSYEISSFCPTSADGLHEPQQAQALGPGTITRSRGRCAGNGLRDGLRRVKARTCVVSLLAATACSAAISSSVAAASSSSS